MIMLEEFRRFKERLDIEDEFEREDFTHISSPLIYWSHRYNCLVLIQSRSNYYLIQVIRTYLKDDKLNKVITEREADTIPDILKAANSAAYRLQKYSKTQENPGLLIRDGHTALRMLLSREELAPKPKPKPSKPRRRTGLIGREATSDFELKPGEISFDLDRMGPSHLIITGSTGSGKTVAAQRIVDQVVQYLVPVLVLTPEEEWLRMEGAIQVYLEEGMDRYLQPSVNVIDLSEADKPYQSTAEVLREIYHHFHNQKETDQLRFLIGVEEAHHLLEDEENVDLLERFARVMRKRGVGLLLISHVYSDFPKGIRANISTQLFMGTDWRGDINFIKQYANGKRLGDLLLGCPPGFGIFRSRYLNQGRPTLVYILPPGESIEEKESGLSKRRKKIMEIIKAHGPISAGGIIDRLRKQGFAVVESTIYRDLNWMEKQEYIQVAKKGKRGKKFYELKM